MPFDPSRLTPAWLAERCLSTCAWPRCTGKGDTDRWAHACPHSDLVPDPPACQVPDCGRPGRLLPHGRLCDDHRPPVPVPDPTRTAAGLARRTDWPPPASDRYGTATDTPTLRRLR